MKRTLIGSIAIICLAAAVFYLRYPLGQKVIIKNHQLTVELAITDAEKHKGLGDRASLAPDHGMVFVYRTKDRYGFWMKGMQFPLDYIWIDGNTVVDLSQNVPAPQSPNDPPVELAPRVPVDKILEVNAGTIKALGIQIGDSVQFRQ